MPLISIKKATPPSRSAAVDHTLHEKLLGRYGEYCECLNYSSGTIEMYLRCIQSALKDMGLHAVWEISPTHVRSYNVQLVRRGLATATRRSYCAAIRSIFNFMIDECADEVETATGTRLRQPVTATTAPRVRFGDSYVRAVPPSKKIVRRVTKGLRAALAETPRVAVAGRDLAMIETLYLTAMRANELVQLDVDDLYPGKGDGGQIHIRCGKGSYGSGPRPRWIPMLDGVRELLAWYVGKVRPRLRPRRSRALFLSSKGNRLTYDSAHPTLKRAFDTVGLKKGRSLHRLRHARATHLFEAGMDLVGIQLLLVL